jgi:hypothetical protein
MTHRKQSSKVPTNRVDWSDPHLESLLLKTESWQLDNRGSYPPQEIHIQTGWGAGIAKSAVLVWERDQVMVIETRFPIEQGEHVRLEKPFGDGVQTIWGVVVESRAGHRNDDEANGVQVHWLHRR